MRKRPRENRAGSRRAGKELAERSKIGVTGLVDPFGMNDQFVTKDAQSATERGEPRFQEGHENLLWRSAGMIACTLMTGFDVARTA